MRKATTADISIVVACLPGERWSYIPGYSRQYMASTLGRVLSIKQGRQKVLRQNGFGVGYLGVSLWVDGKVTKTSVHRIVSKTFMPSRIIGLMVNHKNGIKTDNKLSNLEWVTARRNVKHAYDMGLLKSGENHGKAKLSSVEVLKIRESTLSCGVLAKRYDVSRSLISGIKRGEFRANG